MGVTLAFSMAQSLVTAVPNGKCTKCIPDSMMAFAKGANYSLCWLPQVVNPSGNKTVMDGDVRVNSTKMRQKVRVGRTSLF